MEKYIKQCKSFVERVKKIKNKEIIIGLVIIAVVVVIYSNIASASEAEEVVTAESAVSTGGITDGIEERLSEILSMVEGAGNVQVMVSYETTSTLVAAVTTESYTTESNGSVVTTSTETPLILTVNGDEELVILQEVMPEIVGIIVVAEGGDDISVKIDIINAIQTVLNVNANQIVIFAGKIQ